MAEAGPIHITLDEPALRAQVRQVLDEELAQVADGLLQAAFSLAPEHMMRRDDLIAQDARDKVQQERAEEREQRVDQ